MDSAAAARRFVYQFPARISDLNFFGHLDNVSILRILDETRAFFMGHRGTHDDEFTGGLLGPCGGGLGILVAAQRIEYRRELFFTAGAPLEVTMWLSRVGGSSVVVASELRQAPGEPLAAQAETSVVLITRADGRPWRIPDEHRRRFEEYAGDRVPFRDR